MISEIPELFIRFLPKIALVIAITMIAFVILEPFLEGAHYKNASRLFFQSESL